MNNKRQYQRIILNKKSGKDSKNLTSQVSSGEATHKKEAATQSDELAQPNVEINPNLLKEVHAMKADSSMQQTSANQTVENSQASDPPQSNGTLSVEDAERYASSIRPSWDSISEEETFEEEGAKTEPPPSSEADTDQDTPPPKSLSLDDTDASIQMMTASIKPVKSVRNKSIAIGGVATLILIAFIWVAVGTENEQQIESWDKPEQTSLKVQTATPQKPETTKEETASKPTLVEPDEEPKNEENVVAASSSAAEATPSETSSVASLAAPSPSVVENNTVEATSEKAKKVHVVHIKVSTSPITAKLWLDDKPVSNPYDEWLEKGGVHVIKASQAGYRNKIRKVTFNKNQKIQIALSKKRKVRRTTSSSLKASNKKQAKRKTKAKKRARKKTAGAGFVTESPY